MGESNIADFFSGKSVFITGSTGFMGKVLVEKLLRSCPGIKCLYLLIRPSQGKAVTCRLQELIDNQVNIISTQVILKILNSFNILFRYLIYSEVLRKYLINLWRSKEM